MMSWVFSELRMSFTPREFSEKISLSAALPSLRVNCCLPHAQELVSVSAHLAPLSAVNTSFFLIVTSRLGLHHNPFRTWRSWPSDVSLPSLWQSSGDKNLNLCPSMAHCELTNCRDSPEKDTKIPLTCILQCANNTTCILQCANNTTCILQCANNTICILQCANNTTCILQCANNTTCILQCANNTTCILQCANNITWAEGTMYTVLSAWWTVIPKACCPWSQELLSRKL
jgi:hypothetical protein